MALEAVRSDPVVAEKLGKPIDDVGKLWEVSITITLSGDRGDAKAMFPVAGPKGRADVTSEARRSGGKWSLTDVEVQFSNGEKHLLDIKADATGGGLDDAPPWRPPGEVGPEGMPGGTSP
jgi:hypothetical protein